MSNRHSFSLNHFAIKLFCHVLFYPLAAVIRWATFFNIMLPRPWLHFSAYLKIWRRVLLGKNYYDRENFVALASCLLGLQTGSLRYEMIGPIGVIHNLDAVKTKYKMITTASQENKKSLRGFSSAEKWVIWAVFCLLVGLSSHWLVFPALLMISWSTARFRWYVREQAAWLKRWPSLLAFLGGVGLVLWAVMSS
jgi:hypothetical protein